MNDETLKKISDRLEILTDPEGGKHKGMLTS